MERGLEYLGGDVSGPGAPRSKRRTRARQFRARCKRLRLLALRPVGKLASGLRRVVQGGLKAARTYGCRALGTPASALLELRRAMAAGAGKGRTHNLDLYLQLEGLDPTADVLGGPIRAWAAACWKGELEGPLAAAWRRQLARRRGSTRPGR